MPHYVIKICSNDMSGYLFNTRTLLEDIELAKPFATPELAKRYYRRTSFSTFRYEVVVVPEKPTPIRWVGMGRIVE